MFLVQNSEVVAAPVLNGALETTKVLAQRTHQLLSASAETLTIWHKLGDHWFQHRNDDLQAAAAAANRLAGIPDAAGIFKAYGDLVSEGLKRFAEESAAYPNYFSDINAITRKLWREEAGGVSTATETSVRSQPTEVTSPPYQRSVG